jgi:hypothetical protein
VSAWHYKLNDQQLGPVSFKELAELVRQRTVGEGTPVCRAGTMNWEPAWRVPGLFRAAGIVERGDSPAPVEKAAALTPPQGEIGAGLRELPGYVPVAARSPLLTLAQVFRGLIAAVVGVLTVGFFYRWACQAAIAFPMPPTLVDGDLIDSYFPAVGRCTRIECGLLYVDVFAVAAVAAWHAVGDRLDRALRG